MVAFMTNFSFYWKCFQNISSIILAVGDFVSLTSVASHQKESVWGVETNHTQKKNKKQNG